MSAPSHSLGSPPAAGTTAISPATSSMSSNKKRKLNVGTSNIDDNDVQSLYPHLSHALGGENDGFDMTNPSVLKSMQALLTELTHIFSTEYELVGVTPQGVCPVKHTSSIQIGFIKMIIL
jgi:hypothetical protein